MIFIHFSEKIKSHLSTRQILYFYLSTLFSRFYIDVLKIYSKLVLKIYHIFINVMFS